MPLAFASGAGAESREAIGWVIIGGVSVSTLLTLFVVPAFYLWLARYTKPINAIAQRLAKLERGDARGAPAE